MGSNIPGLPAGKWYALTSTICSFTNLGGGIASPRDSLLPTWDANFTNNVRLPILNAMRRGVAGAFSVPPNYRDCYLPNASHKVDNFDSTHNSGFDRLGMISRPPLATEMRADAWDAICHGGKGIFFNPIGSEANANIGITDAMMRGDYDGPSFTTPESNPGILSITFGDCQHPFIADYNDGSTARWDDHLIIDTVARRSRIQVDRSEFLRRESERRDLAVKMPVQLL
jgi:hypothetical protein